MRLVFMICVGLFAAACSSGNESSEVPEAKLFGERAGIIKYDGVSRIGFDGPDGDVSESEIIQFFVWDDWGKKTAKYQYKLETEGTATKTLIRIDQDGSKLTVGSPSGVAKFPQGEFDTALPRFLNEVANFGPKEFQEPFYTELLVRAGFKRTDETGTYLGHDCEIIAVATRKYCLWDGITLYDERSTRALESSVLDEAIFTASGIYLGDVDPAHFEATGLDWPDGALEVLEGHAYK